jgi:iron complex transport system permease protein
MRLGLAALLLLLGLGMSIAYGAAEIPPSSIFSAITSFDGSTQHLIIRTIRLPRALLAMMVGASLAVAGTLMQGLTQNPLAAPGILGINAGAALAVVVVVFGLGISSPPLIALVALMGAFLAAIAVYFLSLLGARGATPLNLTVTGVAVTTLLTSLTVGVLIKSERTLEEVRFWLAGSLASRDFDLFVTVLPLMIIGLLSALVLGKQINTLSLGAGLFHSKKLFKCV